MAIQFDNLATVLISLLLLLILLLLHVDRWLVFFYAAPVYDQQGLSPVLCPGILFHAGTTPSLYQLPYAFRRNRVDFLTVFRFLVFSPRVKPYFAIS